MKMVLHLVFEKRQWKQTKSKSITTQVTWINVHFRLFSQLFPAITFGKLNASPWAHIKVDPWPNAGAVQMEGFPVPSPQSPLPISQFPRFRGFSDASKPLSGDTKVTSTNMWNMTKRSGGVTAQLPFPLFAAASGARGFFPGTTSSL